MRIKTVTEQLGEELDKEVSSPAGHEIVDKAIEKELAHYRKLSISDLISGCNDAVGKMSNNNPHKILIYNCAMALRQLVDRLDKYENPQGHDEPKLVV